MNGVNATNTTQATNSSESLEKIFGNDDNIWENDYQDYNSGEGYYSGYDNQFDDHIYWESQLAFDIYKYVSLPMLIVGVCGNGLSFIVFSKKPMSNAVSSLFFRALAVFDSLLLLVCLTRYWIIGTYRIDISDTCTFLCLFQPYLFYWAKDLSGWILAVIAVERFLGVSRPHWNKIMFTTRRARIILVVLVAVLLITNIPVPVFHTMESVMDYEANVSYKICEMRTDIESFNRNVWPYIDSFKHSVAPFLIILLCNVCIICIVVRANKKRRTQMYSGQDNHNMSSMTCILLAVSLVYLLCSLPAGVLYAVRENVFSQDNISDKTYAQWNLCASVMVVLICTNSTVNFILYCISGPKFRDAVKNLFVSDRELRRGSSRSYSRSTLSTNNPHIYARSISTASRKSTKKTPV